MRTKRIVKLFIRHWLLVLCEKILGDDMEPEEQKLFAICYLKLSREAELLQHNQ